MKWIKYFILVLFHPVDTFYLIKKDRKQISKIALLVILALAVTIKILYVYTVNFTVSATSAANANAVIEIGMILVPFVLWAVASYALMTVCGGESTFMETLAISIYSLAPYIVFTPILILISQMLSSAEITFFIAMRVIVIAWMVILLFVGFMQSNNLKFSHSLGLGIISVLVMALIVVVILLAFGLGAQIIRFIQEVVAEIKYFAK